jgi:serine/threonine protein kinase
VEELFEEALTRPAEERISFLSKACGEDKSLRDDVESLLSHREALPADFMRPPAPGRGMSILRGLEAPDLHIGKEVGKYRIKSVIASGGMGTVYLAEQENPKRDVALKVMRTGIASRSAMRRFEYESQILAKLRHPNIAQIHEAGTARMEITDQQAETRPSRSVPYFAMEYVPGAKSITKYAEEHELSTRERLRLFAQVCEAVCHGHQKGIIHRDLKPANILVANEQSRDREGAVGVLERGPLAYARGSDLTSQAQVKVIDFGVARSTDSDIAITTLHTDVGQIIGTLQYMSPE